MFYKIEELIGIAMGCIGMSIEDFERCTPSEFRAIYEMWQRQMEKEERGAWERMRMLGTCMLAPYSKRRLEAKDVMRFPWDEEEKSERENQTESKEVTMKRYTEAKRRYGLI